MNRSHLWKLLLILFVVGWSAYELYPPQGRDLLAVFQEKAEKKDAAFSNIVAQARQLMAAKPDRPFGNLKDAVGTNDLTKYFGYIETKGEKDPNAFILYWLQREAAGRIRLGLDLQGGTSFLVQMDTSKLADGDTNQAVRTETKEAALSHAVEVLRKRVDKLGVAEPILQPAGSDRILIQLPGLSQADQDQAKRVIQKAAFLTIRMVHPDSETLVPQGIIEPGYEILREVREREDGTKVVTPFLVNKKPERGLTGKYIKRAGVSRDQYTGKPEILFELDAEGAKIFADVTREYQPKGNKRYQLAIVLDDELYSAPYINEPIEGGRVRITGSFTEKEAFELANVLENPLEAPVSIISENTVDPSLGKDSIASGVKAAVIGTIAVAVFMLVYYLVGGVVANVALLLNILILLGFLCYIRTTLTLPGIAGIVLTIGMAVDANVLIFERIREELAAGKSMRGALAAGYDKAFGTIFDSNLTTLIASVILIFMGTGPVKGFGVTLTIGVMCSMFTALVVTRLIFDFLLARGWLKAMPMLHIIRGTKVDFLRWAIPAFVASWVLILIGNGYGIFVRGSDVLGVEFAGGDTVALNFTKKVEVDQLRDTIGKLGVGDVMIQYQKDPATQKETLRVTTRAGEEGRKAAGSVDASQRVIEELKTRFKDSQFEVSSVEKVGATVGREIQRTAVVASLLAMFGILVYVAFRYEFSFAVGAVIAIIHDILMTLGWFFLSGRELSGPIVAAALTIIGFSINDTIVIFDRIREDLKLGMRGTFKELMNRALNQTLSRTIITSGTVFLSTLSLYLFGGGVINDFAFTFLVGILTGTYSSIYIASAIVLWWHRGERPKIGPGATLESAAALERAATSARVA
jgi:SecD/SecF fusion protein